MNRPKQRYEPPTKSTIQGGDGSRSGGAGGDPAALCRAARLAEPEEQQRQALAADGKWIRDANRNGTLRYATTTLVKHTTCLLLASLNFRENNGELAAVGALLEVVPIAGSVLTQHVSNQPLWGRLSVELSLSGR